LTLKANRSGATRPSLSRDGARAGSLIHELRDVRVWVVAGGVLAASEICSTLVSRDIPILYIHWVLKPVLGIANVPNTDQSYLGMTGLVARLLHSSIVLLAAIVVLWLASQAHAPIRWGWYGFGQGLFIGGATANAYQLLVAGRVLDWITLRPLVALGLQQGYPTYSLGDTAAALGFAFLVGVVFMKSRHRSTSRARKVDPGSGVGDD
jgi:lipoprotein signal peptidase